MTLWHTRCPCSRDTTDWGIRPCSTCFPERSTSFHSNLHLRLGMRNRCLPHSCSKRPARSHRCLRNTFQFHRTGSLPRSDSCNYCSLSFQPTILSAHLLWLDPNETRSSATKSSPRPCPHKRPNTPSACFHNSCIAKRRRLLLEAPPGS